MALLRRIRTDFNCNKIILSAYADEVTVFINRQDVINLSKSTEVYERASTAKVN